MFNDVEIAYKTNDSAKYIAKSYNAVVWENDKGVTLNNDFISIDSIFYLKINGMILMGKEETE